MIFNIKTMYGSIDYIEYVNYTDYIEYVNISINIAITNISTNFTKIILKFISTDENN